MTPTDLAFTTAWWERLLADEAAMVRWLQKLHGTEFSGLQDNIDAAERWTTPGTPQENVFLATGRDEMRHSELLVDVLRGRGAWPIEVKPPESDYWFAMEKVNTSLETCAAIFHLGEHLAAERFQVLHDHPDTPSDIMTFLVAALPDERHHARIFRKLTTPDVLREVLVAHEAAVALITGRP